MQGRCEFHQGVHRNSDQVVFPRVSKRTHTKWCFTSSVQDECQLVSSSMYVILITAIFFSSVGGFSVVHCDISTAVHHVDSLLQYGSAHGIH